MLVSLYVKNFRSIDQTVGISFVAVDAERQKPEHLVAIPGSKLYCLRTGVVYGANAAGKSNICRALAYLRWIVLDSRPMAKRMGREPFAFAKDRFGTTDFDIRFVSQEHLYRYFISVDDEVIRHEILVDETGGGERTLFERVQGDGEDSPQIEFPGEAGTATTKKIRSLVSVGIAPVQSFLSAMKMLIARDEDRLWANPAIAWFQRLYIVFPDSSFRNLERMIDDAGLKDYIGAMMSDCSTGVCSIESRESAITENDYLNARRLLPEAEQRRMDDEGLSKFVLRKGDDVVVYEKSAAKITQTVVRASHGSRGEVLGELSLNQESDGTRRLLNLLPALYALKREVCVYVIDEVDRSLHPLLTREFVNSFLSNVPCGQLVITTHDNNLLDADLFRRDEVWFAEKDRNQATHFFSLSEFKPRMLKSQGDYYLEGRFGAIPVLRKCRVLDMRKESAR